MQGSEEKLKVAWRYNDLLEEKMLGKASAGNAKEHQIKLFRYDVSKPMGSAVANDSSHGLDKDRFMVHLPFDLEVEGSSLVTLWESICETI